MRSTITLAVAMVAATALASPSFAATMAANNSMMMMSSSHATAMKPGDTLLVMPNGQTMMMKTPAGRISTDMMQGAMPVDKCMIITLGDDGKMMMATDSMLQTGMMACDELSKMKH